MDKILFLYKDLLHIEIINIKLLGYLNIIILILQF